MIQARRFVETLDQRLWSNDDGERVVGPVEVDRAAATYDIALPHG